MEREIEQRIVYLTYFSIEVFLNDPKNNERIDDFFTEMKNSIILFFLEHNLCLNLVSSYTNSSIKEIHKATIKQNLSTNDVFVLITSNRKLKVEASLTN